MTFDAFITLIEAKIQPHSLNDIGTTKIANLYRKYPSDFLIQCVDIGAERYLRYDSENHPTTDSVNEFINKLGGIAHNLSRPPIEQEMKHVINLAKKHFMYWNDKQASHILEDYVDALRNAGYSDSGILSDLQTEVIRITNRARNWSEWRAVMEGWINELNNPSVDSTTITQQGTIIPDAVISNSPNYIKKLCMQINASYENNLFDCTAVMMRRVMEILLILSYRKNNIEADIINPKTNRHLMLDGIVKNAEQNQVLGLSANTKHDMALIKDLGNYSAHKIWYNCTNQDIDHCALKYRAIIEELLYKSGLN